MAASESEDGPTLYCKNCKHDIPEQNFEIHEIHCRRNLILCQKCEEPVPRSIMEEHMEEYHALVLCKCKVKVEKSQLEKHENEDCFHRMMQCQFCEVSLKHVDLPDHENACGSRTEKCEKCGSYVMIRSAMIHECSKPIEKPPTYQTLSEFDGFNFHTSVNGLDDDVYTDALSTQSSFPDYLREGTTGNRRDYVATAGPRRAKRNRRVPTKSHSASKDSLKNPENGDHVAKDLQELNLDGRNARKKVANVDERQKKLDRTNHIVKVKSDKQTEVRKTRRDRGNEDNFDLGIEGSGIKANFLARGNSLPNRNFVHNAVVSDGMPERNAPQTVNGKHVVKGPLKTSIPSFPESNRSRRRAHAEQTLFFNVEDEPEQFEATPIGKEDTCPVNKLKREEDDKIKLMDKSFELPCEICESLVPVIDLELHQEMCLMQQQEALRTFDKEIPVDVEEPLKIEPIVIDNKVENDEEPSIPCEFCEEGFPANSVILHQPYCDMNPLRYEAVDSIHHLNTDNDVSSGFNQPDGFWQSRLNPERFLSEEVISDNPFHSMRSLTRDLAMNVETTRQFQADSDSDRDDVMTDDFVNVEDDGSTPSTRQRNWPYDRL